MIEIFILLFPSLVLSVILVFSRLSIIDARAEGFMDGYETGYDHGITRNHALHEMAKRSRFENKE